MLHSLMNLKIKTKPLGKCTMSVQDVSTSYLRETEKYISNRTQGLKKSDTKSLILVQLNSLRKDPSIKTSSFESKVSLDFDGHFSLYYIVLPTKEWVYNMEQNLPTRLGLYEIIFYIYDNKVYQYVKNEEDILISDTSILLDYLYPGTIISAVKEDSVSVCNLQKCYVNLCQQIFESRAFSQCSNKNKIDCELTYKRDLVWMALTVIHYMVKEQGSFTEAQRIVELLNSCNGVCGDNKSRSNGKGCGCS